MLMSRVISLYEGLTVLYMSRIRYSMVMDLHWIRSNAVSYRYSICLHTSATALSGTKNFSLAASLSSARSWHSCFFCWGFHFVCPKWNKKEMGRDSHLCLDCELWCQNDKNVGNWWRLPSSTAKWCCLRAKRIQKGYVFELFQSLLWPEKDGWHREHRHNAHDLARVAQAGKMAKHGQTSKQSTRSCNNHHKVSQKQKIWAASELQPSSSPTMSILESGGSWAICVCVLPLKVIITNKWKWAGPWASGNCAILFPNFVMSLDRNTCHTLRNGAISSRSLLRTQHPGCPKRPTSKAGTKSSRSYPVPNPPSRHILHLVCLCLPIIASISWNSTCTCLCLLYPVYQIFHHLAGMK